MYLITFHIRGLHQREFSDRVEAIKFFNRLLTNCYVHTIMFFDKDGELLELE